ncbi:hypothetical protein FS837_000718 [Tulasnella sp. UAMH 9824]|nr:hypothetical protein FS837_000718 [Tulasnella sp. UAMH 9824]
MLTLFGSLVLLRLFIKESLSYSRTPSNPPATIGSSLPSISEIARLAIMSTSPQPTTNPKRSNVMYPMGIFDDEPSASSYEDEAQEPVVQTPHELVSASLDVHHHPSVDVDPDSDSDDSMLEWAETSSWHSAESNVDQGDENLQAFPPPPVIEDDPYAKDDDPYVEDVLDAAMSQLSMDDLARNSVDSDDAMSISDINETSDVNPNSSSFAAANTSGVTMDSNDDVEESIVLSDSPDVFAQDEALTAGSNDASSGSQVPFSRGDITLADRSIIAHSKKHTEWFDKYGVPWSAQWQVAVMVSNGKKKWEDITEQSIQELSGNNSTVGPKVLRVLFPNERQRAPGDLARCRLGNPYVELDREEAALDKETLETLGLCSPSDNTTDLRMGTWWGGRIEQRAVMLISKWCARFKLGLSASQPVLLFDTASIHVIDDIVSTSHDPGQGPADAKHVMNDGCGLINRAALRLVQRQKEMQSMPTALQGRIAGAKGLWILDPHNRGSRPQIWLTKSQIKITYTPKELDEDPSRRIFDLLRVSQVKEPVRLPMHPIINFAHNGIPHTVFSELLQESLKSTIDQVLEDWDSDDAVAMWSMIFNRSGVGNIRKRRYDRFSERIFGNFRDTEEKEENLWTSEGLTSLGDVDNLVDSGPDPNSGWPSKLAEQIIDLLEAGFIPSKCSHLAALMKSYLKMEVKWITREYRIPLKRSAEVFAAPDFTRTLKPGEVFFCSSRQSALVDDDDMIDGIFNGQMIIFRNPTKTPSDARLVTAVDYPQLRQFTDVLLFSVLGERSGASILAGGDYDGDTVCMIAEPRLVNAFRNSNLRFADPPDGFDECLETAVRHCDEVFTAMSSMNEAERIHELQMVLLDDVTREDRCGLYSNMSDSAAFMYGLNSDKTHYLSYMYFNELDAGKSGKHVKSKTWEKDQKEFRHLIERPACMKKAARGQQKRAKQKPEESDSPRSEENDPPRSEDLGPFVLNVLKHFSEEQEDKYIRLIEKLDIDADADRDPALLAPLLDAKCRARQLHDEGQDGMVHELKEIKRFVKMNRKSWAELFNDRADHTSNPSSLLVRTGSHDSTLSSGSDFFDLSKAVQIQKKRKISDEFWNGFQSQLKHFSEDGARTVMCSYAYHHAGKIVRAAKDEGNERSFEYAFVVAFKALAELKGKAHGGLYSTCVEPFHDLMVPRRGIRNEGRM